MAGGIKFKFKCSTRHCQRTMFVPKLRAHPPYRHTRHSTLKEPFSARPRVPALPQNEAEQREQHTESMFHERNRHWYTHPFRPFHANLYLHRNPMSHKPGPPDDAPQATNVIPGQTRAPRFDGHQASINEGALKNTRGAILTATLPPRVSDAGGPRATLGNSVEYMTIEGLFWLGLQGIWPYDRGWLYPLGYQVQRLCTPVVPPSAAHFATRTAILGVFPVASSASCGIVRHVATRQGMASIQHTWNEHTDNEGPMEFHQLVAWWQTQLTFTSPEKSRCDASPDPRWDAQGQATVFARST
ncbi:hypothetical protein BD779DRAFT_1469411 [Infundibulicybe gibba]|nr:hypothetical protein BD779DRAFT_1469411 [Infundibulicybe gibba]